MDDAYTVNSLSPMRKVIAARMIEAKRTIPHFRLTTEFDVSALLALRRELGEREPGAVPSVNDLLIKACATALMEVPAINIQWADTEIRQYQTADISVVAALDGGGLSTPIIRRANSKSVWEIAREVKELVAKASKNALKSGELFGGSFSLSNLGMYGVDQFDAIINPPQCAILAVGAIKPGVVVSAGGEMLIATVMRVTLSCDHRAIDGATGAVFLAALRDHVEQPAHLCSTKEVS